MKKIYESALNGWDEYAERIYIYTIENDDEFCNLIEMSHSELQEHFEMYDSCYGVQPGAMYSVYNFEITRTHVVVSETVAYNV